LPGFAAHRAASRPWPFSPCHPWPGFTAHREAAARAALRSEELERLSGLSLATDTKLLELIYASRIQRKESIKTCVGERGRERPCAFTGHLPAL
jgi:hypothetical protein